ncbi:TPA: hypothetical protein H1005_04260 [archaeon]|uniref:Exo-alpha-sialidase n=1 Tax=Candidatus Naiadarchaeum limnaeum TaxID=2756139 RepID=A0A832VAQ5_9ARCH|nr:hypothetical protein [Candidatus Naiadarchaeales archaeon SRR2090153.bin1042]HIK00676.1 hypothetical protein [Candidatus Naiadarchaeum limnaeum]
MKNSYIIVLLAAVLIISGCISAQGPLENKTETPIGGNVTTLPPEPVNISVPPTSTEKTYSIIDEKLATPGKNPAIAIYNGKLWIAYERFTGSSEDIYVKSFDGKSFGSDVLIENSDIDDIQPASISYSGNLYIFYTQTVPRSQAATIYYKIFNGKDWSGKKEVGALESLFYYYNSSAVIYKNDLYLFWTKGKPTDYGFTSSRLLRGDFWFDGITLTGIAATTDDKNPQATLHGKDILVLYENYIPNGELNDVYVKKYAGGFWSTAVKLTGESENKFKSSGSLYSFNGKVYAIWIEQDDLYMRTSSDGLVWGKIRRLTESDDAEDEPSLMEYNGNLYIAFTKYKEGAPFVYLAKLDG